MVVVPLDEPPADGAAGRRRGDRRPAAAVHADRPHDVRHQPRDQPSVAGRPRRDTTHDHHRTGPGRRAGRPGSDIKLGLTLYSLTSEWAAGRYDLHGLLDTVAAAGIGPGIEIVASQTIRTYPEVTDEFVREWRDAFDRHGFVPSSFGCNLDMGRRRDRDMTLDEEYEFTVAQFRSAHASASRWSGSRARSRS